ncbi:hypothetical protein TrVE_jg2999 [Triparma verrucosa]|uniref:F-box domain-containing protein n=1 Tax=Triparma verrucosa TaxID=1606542 RepID=A0A9W7CMN9_9STRA|nr:hypothetical protein TrVE_jg2999 [Triparma verrucosa]
MKKSLSSPPRSVNLFPPKKQTSPSSLSSALLTMSLAPKKKSPSMTLPNLPTDILIYLMSFLRAYDLGSLQQVASPFNDQVLINSVIKNISQEVYPGGLTEGWKEEKVTGRRKEEFGGFERLRDLEMLVVARVLSRPDAPEGFFVSKAWCKSALKWLDANSKPSHQKKLSKKKGRIRERRLSDALPPWPNVNADLVCEHGSLVRSSKPGAKRKVIDKKAWKVLRKLYPESKAISTNDSECLECRFERLENQRKEQEKQNKGKLERKKVLEVGFVREVFNRTKGVPSHCLRQKSGAMLFSSPTPTPLSCGICSSTPTSVADLVVPIASPPPKQKLPSPARSLRSWPPLGTEPKASYPKDPKVGGGSGMGLLMPDGVLPPPPVFKIANSNMSMPLNAPVPTMSSTTTTATKMPLPPPSPPSSTSYNSPLTPGKYYLLPRAYLQSWRHYIRTGCPPPSPPNFPSLLCASHGKFTPPKHLLTWLKNGGELITEEIRRDPTHSNENHIELLTEAEYNCFVGKQPRIGNYYQENFTVGGGGQVKWGEDGRGACFMCDGEGRGKVKVRTRNRDVLGKIFEQQKV